MIALTLQSFNSSVNCAPSPSLPESPGLVSRRLRLLLEQGDPPDRDPSLYKIR